MDNLSDKERIHKLIDTVMKVAQGDYTVQNELSGKNDDLDALAMGLNMMIDDLRNNVDLEQQNKKIKAINAELKKAKEKAQESDRLKSSFLANMSHEIRSPMNAIMGFSALLGRSGTSPEKQKEFFSYIVNAGNQLLALIDDIIDISKIESNQLKIQKKTCNLNELLHQVFEIVKQNKKLKSKPHMQLILNCDKGQKDCYLDTDEVRFKQIFINLLNNAINFTETGYVELGYTLMKNQKKNLVQIHVKDTGVGIPKDSLNSIFERFRQIHLDRFQEGAGLGLSITQGLVDLLGGKISVESEIGKGSVFYITFPYFIKQKKQGREDIRNIPDSLVDFSKYTIYVAENTVISYIYLEEILKPYGVRIRHAENGLELIDLIEKEIPDLVLLDIHMPVMNGYETIREIRKLKHTFPVVAQTAYATADEKAAILNSGCNGYISKPIDPDALIRELKKHLVEEN
jgi:signal transduction histidine kinase